MHACRPAGRLLARAAALLVCAFVVPTAQAQEKSNPIVARVKAVVKDPAQQFTLALTLHVKEGSSAPFEAAFTKAAKLTRREKGCLAYDLSRDPKMPGHYLVYERWRDLASLEAHLRSEHITTLLGQLGELLAAQPESRVLLPVEE
jgi:quinol monooxygenase YgiN